MIKKKLFVFGLLFLTACGESSGFTENAAKEKEVPLSTNVEYAPEDLLGKTVEEYEAAQDQQKDQETNQSGISPQPEELSKNGFLQLEWDDLIEPGYDANAIIEKYQPQIDTIEHGSEEAFQLYLKMEEEFNNAPVNSGLAGKKVSLPGFIAPLEQVDGMITEFLLVPYFGACIHVPPPPANQTMYVKVAQDYEIRNEDSYDPIWVSGILEIDDTSTDIGKASYQIENAVISKYQYQ